MGKVGRSGAGEKEEEVVYICAVTKELIGLIHTTMTEAWGGRGMQIVEAEDRLKQQQKLYEAVRAERNTYSKNLIQAQDEMLDVRRKSKFLVCLPSLPFRHRGSHNRTNRVDEGKPGCRGDPVQGFL